LPTEPVPVQQPTSTEPQTQTSPVPSTPTKSAGTSPLMSPERAASPLLTEDPLTHLNIKLHAPLPPISPPGSVQAVHETHPVHPVPILLPPFQSIPTLGSPQQPGIHAQLNASGTENTDGGQPQQEVGGSVYDI